MNINYEDIYSLIVAFFISYITIDNLLAKFIGLPLNLYNQINYFMIDIMNKDEILRCYLVLQKEGMLDKVTGILPSIFFLSAVNIILLIWIYYIFNQNIKGKRHIIVILLKIMMSYIVTTSVEFFLQAIKLYDIIFNGPTLYYQDEIINLLK